MPMIVSGLDPQVRMNAYLNGQQAQMQLKKQQDAMRIEQDQQNAAIRAQMQQAMLAHKKEQAKALKDANERAQMGEATAMEQQNMEARAQKKPPEQRRLEEMSGVLAKIPDGPARDAARKEFIRYEDELRTEQQKQAALKMIEAGENDGLAQPGEGQQRMAAGEEPETIAKEYGERKAKLDAATIATTVSADALAKADAIYSTLDPESDIAKAVQARTVAFQNSKTAQETPGESEKFLKGIDDMVLAYKKQQEAERGPGLIQGVKTFSERGGFPALLWGAKQGLAGLTGGGGSRPTEEGQRFAPSTTFREPIGYSGDSMSVLLSEAKDEDDFLARLKEAKIPLTADLARQIATLRQNAAPAGTQP